MMMEKKKKKKRRESTKASLISVQRLNWTRSTAKNDMELVSRSFVLIPTYLDMLSNQMAAMGDATQSSRCKTAEGGLTPFISIANLNFAVEGSLSDAAMSSSGSLNPFSSSVTQGRHQA